MYRQSSHTSSAPFKRTWRGVAPPRAVSPAATLPAIAPPSGGEVIGVWPEATSAKVDRVLLTLLCAWILSLCFDYRALGFRLQLGIQISPDRVVLAALVCVFVLMKAGRSATVERPLAGRAVGRSMWLFAVVALTSWLIVAPDATNLTFGNLTWIMNLGVFPALAFSIASRLQFTRAMVLRVFWFLAIIGAYLSFTAIAEHYESLNALVFPRYILDRTVGTHWGRSRGPFVDTISNGGVLIAAFLAFSCLSTMLIGARRAAALFFTLLIVPAVYFTDTRGVWIAWAAAAGTLAVLGKGLRRPVVLVALALIVAFVLGIGSKFSWNEQTLFSRRQGTVDYRLDNFQIAWGAFKSNPIFGLGYGNFYGEWRDYADRSQMRLNQGLADGNHSTLLGILAELGLSGAVPFVAVIGFGGLLCLSSHRRLKRANLPFERQVAVVSLGILLSFTVLGLTNDLKAMPTVNIITLGFLGLLTSVMSARPQQPGHRAQVPARTPPAPAVHRPAQRSFSRRPIG